MCDRKVPAWRPNFPALEDILGSTQAKILIDLLFDYAYKSSENWEGSQYFSIQEDLYFRRAYTAILEYVSITKENLSKNIKTLKELGLIFLKDSKGESYSYKIYLNTNLYIELAYRKLETVKDKYTRKRIADFIEIVSKHNCILDALTIPEAKMHTFKIKKKDRL